MECSLPSLCEICSQIPNHAHGDLLPGSTEELPDAVKQLKQDGQDFRTPGSTGEWELQCPLCGCCYLLSSETGAFEYDVYVTRLTPVSAWKRGQMDRSGCERLLAALPADLYHDDPEFRSYAASSLAQHYQDPDAPSHDALCALLRSPDEVIRCAATHAIPAARAEPVAEMLVDLLWDPSWKVHEVALYRLCPHRDPAQATRILAACREKLLQAVTTRPLTFNVIQLLMEMEPLPVEGGLSPFLPTLIAALLAGSLNDMCTEDVLELLQTFAVRSARNARAVLAALDDKRNVPLPPGLVDLRRLAAERAQKPE